MKIRNVLLGFCLLFSSSILMADPVWIDLRTAEEVAEDGIASDVHIPLAELDVETLAATYGKDAEIMLYCRSGNRAGQALTILETAGFTQVKNVGSIGDARELRDMAAQSSSTQ